MRKKRSNEFSHLEDQDLVLVIGDVLAILKARGYDQDELFDELEAKWRSLPAADEAGDEDDDEAAEDGDEDEEEEKEEEEE